MSSSHVTLNVLYDYKSEFEEELNIKSGDKLTIIDSSRKWWFVFKDGMTGYIPSNYVEIINLQVKSNYDFSIDSPDILPMKAEEVFQVIWLDEEYYVAKNEDGRAGLLPKMFVEIIPSSKKFRLNCSGEFSDKAWYFGDLSREEAEAELFQYGGKGTFLIRKGMQSDYVISLLSKNNTFEHVKIYKSDNKGFELGDGRKIFSSMEDLIDEYKISGHNTDQNKQLSIHFRSYLGDGYAEA